MDFKSPINFDPIKTNEMKAIEQIKKFKNLDATYKEKYILVMIAACTMDAPFEGTVQELCDLINIERTTFTNSKENLINMGLEITTKKAGVFSFKINGTK